jgi:hypothetical protein
MASKGTKRKPDEEDEDGQVVDAADAKVDLAKPCHAVRTTHWCLTRYLAAL